MVVVKARMEEELVKLMVVEVKEEVELLATVKKEVWAAVEDVDEGRDGAGRRGRGRRGGRGGGGGVGGRVDEADVEKEADAEKKADVEEEVEVEMEADEAEGTIIVKL